MILQNGGDIPREHRLSQQTRWSTIRHWRIGSESDQAISPRRHRGHGDFTEASGFSVHLGVRRGREKKFKIRRFCGRKLLKTLGAFLQIPIFSHDPCLRGE